MMQGTKSTIRADGCADARRAMHGCTRMRAGGSYARRTWPLILHVFDAVHQPPKCTTVSRIWAEKSLHSMQTTLRAFATLATQESHTQAGIRHEPYPVSGKKVDTPYIPGVEFFSQCGQCAQLGDTTEVNKLYPIEIDPVFYRYTGEYQPSSKCSARMTIRLRPELHAALEKSAAENRTTAAGIVRNLVTAFVSQYPTRAERCAAILNKERSSPAPAPGDRLPQPRKDKP